MKAERKRINAFGGRGMYEGSRRFPYGRDWVGSAGVSDTNSTGVMGDAGGLEVTEGGGLGLPSSVAVCAEVGVKDGGVISK